MALPKLDVPQYEIELPISKKKIKYRPFLVKEQRNLLMAIESSESITIQQNIRDILNNCTITEGIDIDSLPIIDIEYYFLNLRARSVGEVVNLKYTCNNEVTGEDGEKKKCGGTVKFDLNLLEVKPTVDEGHDKKIQLIEILKNYPTSEVYVEGERLVSLVNQINGAIASLPRLPF
jgi:hypothetical protein